MTNIREFQKGAKFEKYESRARKENSPPRSESRSPFSIPTSPPSILQPSLLHLPFFIPSLSLSFPTLPSNPLLPLLRPFFFLSFRSPHVHLFSFPFLPLLPIPPFVPYPFFLFPALHPSFHSLFLRNLRFILSVPFSPVESSSRSEPPSIRSSGAWRAIRLGPGPSSSPPKKARVPPSSCP